MQEFEHKTYSKPRDLFDDACLLIAKELEAFGFTYSKSQASIKKKDKLLNYSINFFSSYRNYIDEENGRVIMEFYCAILHKKEIIFRLTRKELRSEIHRFQIFDSKTFGIDYSKIEEIINFIKKHYLPIVNALQENPNHYLGEIAKTPVARFDDYGFKYEDSILKIFDREDLQEIFDENVKLFKSKIPEENRRTYKKHILPKFRLSVFENEDPEKHLQLLKSVWTKTNFEKFLPEFHDDYQKVFEAFSKTSAQNTKDWWINFFILLNACKDYITDSELKEKANALIIKFHEALKN